MKVAVIPARGGSVRIPRKNIRQFHWWPLIRYSIEAAKQSGLFDRIIVSTDYVEIGETASMSGAEIFMRDQGMSEENIGTQQVAAEVMQWLNDNEGMPDWCCCIYATAPMMTAHDLKWSFEWVNKDAYRYVYVPGWYYWGRPKSFIEEPDNFQKSLKVYVSGKRWIDINTEEDWRDAEQMYAELHGVNT